MTNYIPYFGAIISGAFAVLVAWGAGGPSMGVPMLIIVIIANGFLQTLVSQFALGSALNLHPLSVLFATTAGGILFGAVGGVFAAPFLKIGRRLLRAHEGRRPLRRRLAPESMPATPGDEPGSRRAHGPGAAYARAARWPRRGLRARPAPAGPQRNASGASLTACARMRRALAAVTCAPS